MPRYFDNTRISSYRECPRRYYFRHVKHWRSAGTAASLVFGAAWHSAMDIVWQLAKTDKSDEALLVEAMKAFWEKWEEEGMPKKANWSLDTEEQLSPRTPNNAADMLAEYIHQRRDFLRRIELLAVEKPFAVLLDPEDTSVLLVGRRDKDFKYEGFIYTGEHKTTTAYKKDGGFKYEFIESFSPNAQVDGYLHSGMMEYGYDHRGVWIDAALVHNKERNFKFIPVNRAVSMLDGWLSDTKRWIKRILDDTADYEIEKLSSAKREHMSAFPKNTDACQGKYGSCPYVNLCKAWPNPDIHRDPPPLDDYGRGFIVEKWEPFAELKLDTIGLKPEEK